MKALFLWRIHGKGGQEKEGRGVPTAANHLCRQFGFSWRGNKGQIITKEEAVERRKRGEDVVVCGVDLNANKYLAKGIEAEAIGDMAMVKICPPHPNAGLKPCRTANRWIVPRKATRFTKPRSGKPPMPDYEMKFFTPDLYMRYNSLDEKISAEADAEWEQAIENYQRHLHAMPLTENVKKLSKQCFHDALFLDKTMHPVRFASQFVEVTTLLLRQSDRLIQLIYSGKEPVSIDHSPEWNLWESAKRWLYDEIDIAENDPRMFLHRILWSDGNVLTIPFADVSHVSVPLHHQNPSSDTGVSAIASV